MTKAELVKTVASQAGLTSKQATLAVSAMIDAIGNSLVKSGEFSYVGFGRLHAVHRPGRLGRNPSTGEKISIKPSKGVKFSASSRLKEKLAAVA